MHKLDLFKLVLKSDTYQRRSWVLSAFALTQENKDAYLENPYPYRIVQTPTNSYFYDPQLQDLQPIEGTSPGNPIYKFTDRIVLQPGDLPNVTQEIETTIGNAYYNKTCICDAFGSKVSYQSGLKLKKLEDEISIRLRDTPTSEEHRDPKYIYVDEYIKFADAVFYLTNFTQLCTWGLTEKVISPPPGIEEFKKTLLVKYKGTLHDPAMIAAFMAELRKYDAEYLKGDPGLNFLLSAKSKDVVRSKLHLAYGAESRLDGSKAMDLVPNSLVQGWDSRYIPAMNNAARGGSYGRGAETQLGGVSFKELNRAFANAAVTIEDCKTTLGKTLLIEKSNLNQLLGFHVINPDKGTTLVETEEQAAPYLGKVITRRSPQYCIAGTDNMCQKCAGIHLSRNPSAVGVAVANLGSTFMGFSMASAHSRAIKSIKCDWRSTIT